ncbi:MAG: hypothetical protein ABJZ55_00855 [Fuerstiella sp.]
MKWISALVVYMSFVGMNLVGSAALGQQQGGQQQGAQQQGGQQQRQLRFSAADILPASVLKTKTYEITDRVFVKDHKFQFSIETAYGTFPVTGIPLLEKRLSELRAIEEASQISRQPVAVSGAWSTLRRTPQGAQHLLTDPLGTFKQAPTGIRKMAANFVDPVSRRTGSESRRKLAANLGVDPETRNPVLHQLLVTLAAREMVGQSATKFALSAAIPGLGTLASMEDMRDAVAARSPHELLQELDVELTRMETWRPVKDAFVKSSKWTLLEKLTFLQSYKQLANIEHSDLMLYLASQDETEEDILRRLIVVRLLAELHSKSPIQSISDAGLPIALLKSGQIVGVCSIDYLTDSEEVRRVATEFRKNNSSASISLLSAGWVSPDAKTTLSENRINFLRADFAVNPQAARLSNAYEGSRR